MAPRRLLALILGLLLFSSLITVLIGSPSQERLDTTSPQTGSKRPVPALPAGGKLLDATIRANSPKRPVLKARVGDQLSLMVRGSQPGTVELVGLGEVDDIAPNAPATFNVLLLQTGSYKIRTLESDKPIGSIEVTQAGATPQPRSSRGRRSHRARGDSAPA